MSAPTPPTGSEEPTAFLRIVQEAYDGAFAVHLPNGRPLPGVKRVAVYLDADTGQAEAHITVTGVALDVLLPTYARPAPPRPLPGPPAATSRRTLDPAGNLPPGQPDLYQSLQALDEESR